MTSEDLWSNVVGSSNSGVSHNSTRLSPIVDSTSVADGKVDLVEVDRITIPRLVGLALEELLVV
jgi:hypothetical protein